jgi:uncharacterized membrane protein YfcA
VEDLILLCGFAFLAGLIDAVAGGGGLIQVPALFAFAPGIPPVALLGTNKLSSVAGTAAALLRYQRTVPIDWTGLRFAIVSAGLAAAFGAWTVAQISGDVLRPIVLALLVAVCIYTLSARNLGMRYLQPTGSARSPALFCAGVGFHDGFFGPGAGSLLMFGLVKWFRRGFLQAAAETKAINLSTNVGALSFFAASGALDYRLGTMMAVANVVGGYVGAATAVKEGAPFIRRIFLIVTFALMLKIAFDLLTF